MHLSSDAEIIYPLFRKIRLIKKKNPVRYQNRNFAGLFLIPFNYLNGYDRNVSL